jgi:thioredoxin 1
MGMSASLTPNQNTQNENGGDNLITNLTDQNFKDSIAQGFTLVDFWAEWCAPCRAIAPIVHELTEKYKGKVKVAKLDIDNNPVTQGAYSVMSIPLCILFKDGEPVDSILGARPKQFFEQLLQKHIPDLA